MERRELRLFLVVTALIASIATTAHGADDLLADVDAALRSRDYVRAATLLEPRAAEGDAEAQYRLATLYRSGRGVPAEPVSAFKWMLRAAAGGHTDGAYSVEVK